MMTMVCLLGIGAALTPVAGTQGAGTAAWRSSKIGKNLASAQSDMASAGSLLGPSTQRCGLWGFLPG
uniref:Alternative protein TGM3 n=1 Tax=Homo sapiens TaxID=9606 RepID=L8E7G4_HUMAN|nr:alternative protein TGM3 [Homo sapiens]